MFIVDDKCYSWSSTSHGRGKRSEIVGAGVYVIEHIATGKYLVGLSKTVSNEVDKHIAALRNNSHQNKAMLGLVHRDMDLRLLEYPISKVSDQKALIAKIRATTEPKYLMLN
ncbi:endonuclease [Pseudomonas phage vB_Pae10145-KEN51]|uniref:PHIKZ272 n=6 Tax=Viruses TaxID=10239 RepID=Q8SCP0_BPDPK|nr:hypothetical protein [Pseudomonas aeruginosa]NP_803838.1 endonuclease [Pseudomonas phage phiKZ]YP_009619591.1 endonuclease [Pseudomonas phage SL2]ANM45087.1 hypothetical protein KTN4_329 [Pseudomonas phage KTN4]QGK89954.1 hypothetical protein [Pseudomonas phage vB_PA32_GUMS]QJB22963.1 hypothetical protein fnug_320 [Pseudomonas phage fnug]QOV08177.1 hypothetical protein [Pseudomonas phage vB_PaeM_kmuB]QXN68397.1 hypothetical protein [Pseudomonas phage PA7]QYV98873.1 hypothetical protein [